MGKTGPPKAPATLFRLWLIDKLRQTQWRNKTGESVEALAMRLGVQPDVLASARLAITTERTRAGRWRREGGRRVLFEVAFPEPVYQDWLAYCRLRNLPAGTVLRSLVHTLLSGPDQPAWVGRGWMYHGKRVKMDGYGEYAKRGKKWPHCTKADVTPGAKRALTTRARHLGTTGTALARGMILELLEGRLQRLIIVSDAGGLFDDETRYWTGA